MTLDDQEDVTHANFYDTVEQEFFNGSKTFCLHLHDGIKRYYLFLNPEGLKCGTTESQMLDLPTWLTMA